MTPPQDIVERAMALVQAVALDSSPIVRVQRRRLEGVLDGLLDEVRRLREERDDYRMGASVEAKAADEARAEVAACRADLVFVHRQLAEACAAHNRAAAEAEQLRAELAERCPRGCLTHPSGFYELRCNELKAERDEARAEVERLRTANTEAEEGWRWASEEAEKHLGAAADSAVRLREAEAEIETMRDAIESLESAQTAIQAEAKADALKAMRELEEERDAVAEEFKRARSEARQAQQALDAWRQRYEQVHASEGAQVRENQRLVEERAALQAKLDRAMQVLDDLLDNEDEEAWHAAVEFRDSFDSGEE